jgi:hypothetical protein
MEHKLPVFGGFSRPYGMFWDVLEQRNGSSVRLLHRNHLLFAFSLCFAGARKAALRLLIDRKVSIKSDIRHFLKKGYKKYIGLLPIVAPSDKETIIV